MPKPKTRASSSDSDGSSDTNGEAVSHPGCWLIPVTVEGIETLALIDTGASVSMLGRPLYQKIKQLKQLALQTQGTPQLEGVGGNPIPTLGHAEVEVGVGAGKYKAAVVVSARKERPNFIIGADFLGEHNCDLSLRQKLFTIGEQQVRCVPEHTKATRAKLKLARCIEVPPHSEVVVKCQATSNVKRFDTPYAIAQPADNRWRYAEDGLVIGSSLTAPGSGAHQLPVMNLSNAPRTLPAGTRIGDLYPATSLRQTCEMFEAEPELSDWDSDDEDLLLDVRGTTKTGTKSQGARPHSNVHTYPRMDPDKLPEHLKPLMLDLSEDVTIREREELAAAIYEYQDVFSSGPDDMGCTDLVTHSIDMGEHRRIRLPPRRLPITKQDVEKTEVQKMLDKGVIKLCQSS